MRGAAGVQPRETAKTRGFWSVPRGPVKQPSPYRGAPGGAPGAPHGAPSKYRRGAVFFDSFEREATVKVPSPAPGGAPRQRKQQLANALKPAPRAPRQKKGSQTPIARPQAPRSTPSGQITARERPQARPQAHPRAQTKGSRTSPQPFSGSAVRSRARCHNPAPQPQIQPRRPKSSPQPHSAPQLEIRPRSPKSSLRPKSGPAA